ncbi:hypothetical protein, partial [Escherichia coli]|uniref:hypothetical protein n=1 Tax=Escherichia coli TaxID=562 RepID=UPI0023F7AAD2
GKSRFKNKDLQRRNVPFTEFNVPFTELLCLLASAFHRLPVTNVPQKKYGTFREMCLYFH